MAEQQIQRMSQTAWPPATAFAAGIVVGLVAREAATQMIKAARRKWSHHEYENTVTYDQNLPPSLHRREHPDQPRFGGTGAIGVSPAVAATPTSDE